MTARRCDEFPASYWFRVSYPGERGFFEASALAPRESEKTMPICAQYLRDGHKWIWNPLRKGSRRKTSCCLSTRLSRDSSVVEALTGVIARMPGTELIPGVCGVVPGSIRPGYVTARCRTSLGSAIFAFLDGISRPRGCASNPAGRADCYFGNLAVSAADSVAPISRK
jgi:hypothetical protein